MSHIALYYCSTLENLPQNHDNFLEKLKNIYFLTPFLCNFVQAKTLDKDFFLKAKIDHVYCTLHEISYMSILTLSNHQKYYLCPQNELHFGSLTICKFCILNPNKKLYQKNIYRQS